MNVPAHQRLAGLDGIRAVAVLLVIFHHLCSNGALARWPTVAFVLSQGDFGVDVFFVLSGFLITWLLLNEEAATGRVSLERFYFRRSMRILPPAFAYLGVIALLGVVGVIVVAPRDLSYAWLFARNLLRPGQTPELAHFWSLAVEEQFYLTWPFALVLLPGRRRATLTALAVVALGAWRASGIGHFGQTVNGGQALLIGCALAQFRFVAPTSLLFDRRLNSWPVLTAALAVIGGLEFSHSGLRATDGLHSLSLLSVAVIINAAVSGAPVSLGRLLSPAPLQWVGRLSYSLYLWQQPFCWSALATAWAPSAWPLLLAASLVCAVASYYLIERPALAWRDHLQRRYRPAPSPTAPPASGR